MARLLINGQWYDSLSSSSYYEIDFENVLLEHADSLYPNYQLVKFNPMLSSEHGSAKPDLALIERQYRNWWVVEVELAHHPLSHVLRQVEVFTTAEYGPMEAEYLSRQAPTLDSTSLGAMMRGAPPGVLVLVNAARPEWAPRLRQLGVLLGVAEVFRSELNHHVLRVNGEHPSPPADVVSICRVERLLGRLVAVDSPANLPSRPNGTYLIEYADALTEWERIQVKDRVWLSPVRTSPLPSAGTFALVRGERGQLAFQPVQ